MILQKTDYVQEIKTRLNLQEEFRADGSELIQVGGDMKCCCPFHGEDTPSCKVDPEYFICFGGSCGAKGDAISYLSWHVNKEFKSEGAKFIDVLREGCRRTGIEFEESTPQAKAKPPEDKTVYTLQNFRSMCKFRAKENGEKEPIFNESVNPDTNEVEFIEVRFEHATKKRANGKPSKRFWQASAVEGGFVNCLIKGQKTPLFNRTRLRDSQFVVVVEGAKCMKFLQSLGVTACAAAGGSSNPVENVDWAPLQGKKIVLWPDNDEGGKDWSNAVRKQLEAIGCICSTVDVESLGLDSKDDVVEFYEKTQGDETAKQCAIFELINKAQANGVEQQIEDEISGKRYAIRHPAFMALSSTHCFLPGSMTVLCASPGVSKSFLVSQWIWQMALDGIPASLLALESGNVFHERRVIAQMAGKGCFLDWEWVKNHPDEARTIFTQWKPEYDRLMRNRAIQSPPDDVDLTAEYLLAWIADEARRGMLFVAIDPVTKLSTEENFWKQQQLFVWKANALCRKTGIRLLLVTHPKKGSQGVHMDNMCGSVAFQQNPDSIFWLTEHDDLFHTAYNPSVPSMSEQLRYNRTMKILKKRLGPAATNNIGYFVDWNRLIHTEIGFVANNQEGI